MSFVVDQVRRIDAQLDKLQLSNSFSPSSSIALRHAATELGRFQLDGSEEGVSHIKRLQNIIKTLSTSGTSKTTVSKAKLQSAIEAAVKGFESGREDISAYGNSLEWCAIGKAAAQTYGLVLSSFLDEILPLSNDIWYWDDVLGSYAYSTLYTVQNSPLKLWLWSKYVYQDAKERLQDIVSGEDTRLAESVTARWRRFYGLVRDSIHDRSVANLQSRFISPVTEARVEVRARQKNLKKLRDLSATALGILMDDGFSFEVEEDSDAEVENAWQQNLAKSIILMDAVLQRLTASPEISINDIEEQSFSYVEDYGDHEEPDWNQPPTLARNLLDIISKHLPAYQDTMRKQVTENGKPSRWIRYWILATTLVVSSSTMLRIFFNRREAILTWVWESGNTVKDFWYNWVVEPTKNLIGTIRHNEDSEIALMSKESLQGDRASLERMVVDFAIDNPSTDGGVPLNESEIAEVRSKVREGDLTPVLKVYERDLQSPFIGAIRRDLVRALLIQIQKTKVDVEVAIGGIDALLKSQELVFGFVGLTPSILVCLGLSRWLAQAFGNSRRMQKMRQGRMSRVLRNIDRVLTLSRPTPSHAIPYRDRGMLLCEIHVLRQIGESALPGGVKRDFLEDLNDLVESRTGVSGQLRIVERIRWGYREYIQ